MTDFEKNIKQLNIELPVSKTENKNNSGLVLVKQFGKLLYLSGHGPLDTDGKPLMTGRLGTDLTIEEGQEAARLCGICLLTSLKAYLGDLNKVNQIIKVLGLISSSNDFYEQPKIMNGFSELMLEVFGEKGTHARSAMGTSVLPMNIPVEVEMIVEIK